MSTYRRWLPFLAAAVVLALGAAALGERVGGSVSVGQPNGGGLIEGVRLPDQGPGLVSVGSSRDPEAKYGTEELVGALVRAGAEVERRAAGAQLHVGDLSVQGGGRAPGHESHQNGRDADLLFYALDAQGRVTRPRAVRFDGAGLEVGGEGRRFDRERNWLVLRALIEDREAHLQRVLVSEPLRALLLDYALGAGEPAWIIERAGDAMCDSWSTHDNHFHVRLFCTAEDYGQGCRDEGPLYPWRRTELAASGILGPEVVLDPNRRSPSARRWLATTTVHRLWCP